jgi:phosphatidylglycerophosphate synthase
MLDSKIRPLIDPALDRMASRMAAKGIGANAITIGGLAIGLLAVPALALEAYLLALALILINRLADGLDGAVARRTGPTDFGGFLDIVGDFLFYAAVVFGFALADPEANALAATFLVFAFVGTGSSFLAFAVLAAKRGIAGAAEGGPKAFYYLGGLTEGTETILLFVLACLFPGAFPVFAWVFGGLCLITTASRMIAARRILLSR